MKPPSLSPYGLHRVIGQPGLLPQAAQRLDARLPCQPTELQIAVEQIHIDASSFRQIRSEHADDTASMRRAILDLVRHRGKLHNPVTNSGGMLTGTVSVVGEAFPHPPAPGSRIATLVSLTLTPLALEDIGEIDLRSGAVRATGRAWLFATGLWAALPDDLPTSVALAAFDVAGAPARVRLRTRPGSRVLIIGAGHSGALSAVAACEAGAREVLVADVDSSRLDRLGRLALGPVRPILGDASNAVEFAARVGEPVDLSVSCVNVPGVELACILCTRGDGHVLFFSMATEFTRAALGAEGVSSGATLEIGNGYVPGHAKQVLKLLRSYPLLCEWLAHP